MFSFNYGSITRLWYAILLSLLIVIQFAQVPLEKFVSGKLESNYNVNMAEMITAAPNLSELSENDQKQIAKINESLDRNDLDEDSKKLLSDMKRFYESGMSSPNNYSPLSGYWTQFLLFLGIVGFLNNLALLWLILARVKNIGWSEIIGIGLFSPYFIILFTGPSPFIFYLLYTAFLLILGGLALIPSNFQMFDDDFPSQEIQSNIGLKQELSSTAVSQNNTGGSSAPLFGKR